MRSWLQNRGIWFIINWPPYSLDLNPIKHISCHLKQAVYRLRPDLDNESSKDRQLEILTEVLPEAWRSIRRGIIEGVLDSMPRRVQAVLDAGGWHTKC